MNTSGTCKWRPLCEDETFTDGLSRIAAFQAWDLALAGLSWGIAVNPCQYDLVPGTRRLHLAKSEPVQCDDGRFCRLRVWLAPRDNDEEVDLLAIEATPEEDVFDESDPFGDQ